MNGLERIGAVLQGKKPDRRPYALLLSLLGANYVNNIGLEEYYSNAELWFNGQVGAIERFNPDIVTGPFSFPLEAKAFGSEIKIPEYCAPNIKKPIIADPGLINKLIVPDLSDPSLNFIIKTNKLLVDKYRGNKAVAALIFSPCDLPALLLGIESWVDILLFQKKYINSLMNITIPHFVRMANTCLENGVNFVVTTANFINPDIVNEKIFKSLKPFLIEAFNQIKGPLVIHHGGCRMGSFIPYYAELPNVIGLVIDPRDSLKEARNLISSDTLLLGNIDGPGIINMSDDLIKKKCKIILESSAADPKFIFASSNADISLGTPESKIDIVIESVSNYKLDQF